MKKAFTLLLTLTLALTACTAAAPTEPPAPVEPQILVVTVEVPVVVPAAPVEAPAVAPTEVPPVAQPDVPTDVEESPTAVPTPTLPPAVGGDVLVNITRSNDAFSLRCSPSEITFTVQSASPYITKVEMYYRMTDSLSNITSNWFNAGLMDAQGNNIYSKVFSALDVNPNIRYATGTFDYQFVGLNKTGDVVGRTQKFTGLVTFTLDCP